MNNQWRDNADHMVVWADGTYDHRRSCDQCSLETCSMPVHSDHYKSIGTTALEEDQAEEAASGYWDWMHSNQPLGSSMDSDGSLVTPEFTAANPDYLPESSASSSGITEEQHRWMREAHETLTPFQKRVWDGVQREQKSQTDLADEFGVAQQTIFKALQAAKHKVTEYLRGKSENV